MLIDLHVHTSLSRDSNVTAAAYVEFAAQRQPRLDAICFTEHRLYPAAAATDDEYEDLATRFGIRIFKGIEADTDLGHLLIFGINEPIQRRFDLTGRMHRAERMIEFVHGEGGVAIPAHPFRDSGYGARLDTLCAKLGPALTVIEVINGQNSANENALAAAACAKLGLTAAAGSDAHFCTLKWFMTCATEFEGEVTTVAAMCEELRAGRARPYQFPPSVDPVAASGDGR